MAAFVSQEFQSSPRRAEWVVAALFHDVFGALNAHLHAEMIADVLTPFLGFEVERTLRHHDRMIATHWNPTDQAAWKWMYDHCKERWFEPALRFRNCDIAAFSDTLVYPGHHFAWTNEINEVLP